MPDHTPSISTPEPPWQQLCALCNVLYRDQDSWWRGILDDSELVVRVDHDCVALRLGGTQFLTLESRGHGLHARILPELLIQAHPGSRFVLTEADLQPEPRIIGSLVELGSAYSLVRRRVLARTDRRQAVLDRLYLRHRAVAAVDIPMPFGRIDLMVVAADGTCVSYLLRRYMDADLRLTGGGGIVGQLAAVDHWLADADHALSAVQTALDRLRSLDGPWAGRFVRLPNQLRLYPRARLLIVDFDHAQRLSGLSDLLGSVRKEWEKSQSGLDRTLGAGDILTIGDPGNISHKLLFSGI